MLMRSRVLDLQKPPRQTLLVIPPTARFSHRGTLIFALAVLAVSRFAGTQPSVQPLGIRCNHLENPLGLDDL